MPTSRCRWSLGRSLEVAQPPSRHSLKVVEQGSEESTNNVSKHRNHLSSNLDTRYPLAASQYIPPLDNKTNTYPSSS